MSVPSEEVVARLRKVQQQILAEPHLYDQYEVMQPVSEVYNDPNKCGTMCCVAGWLYINNVGTSRPDIYSTDTVISKAAELIGQPMENAHVSEWPNLFETPDDWPDDFRDDYWDLEVQVSNGKITRQEFDIAKAQVAYERIEHFIETGE